MWFDLDHTLTTGRSRTLEKRADRLSELLRGAQEDPPEQRARKLHAFADATGGGLIEVFETNGTRAYPSSSLTAATFPWPAINPLSHDQFGQVNFSGQPYRVLLRPFSSGSQSLILCVAAPLEGNRQLLHTFSVGLLWAIPVLLTVSALSGYLLSRKALKPVDRITAAARSISVSNLSGRLPVPKTRDELQRLAETCNLMLARLETAVNEIRRFTADASHELRSPLSIMRTVAEIGLRNPHADPQSRRGFEDLLQECAKTGRLLRDMLTLARGDAGNANLSFEVVDLVQVTTEVCDKIRLLPETRQHTLTVSLREAGPVPIWGDYSSVRRLLWTLLENAVKYTPAPGSIGIALTTAAEKVTVTVEDNGIGISEADLSRIFQRFYRADQSRSEVEGFGLGLAIATWIADIHHADLTVESVEHVGSTFQVVFPLHASTFAAIIAPQ